MYLLLHMITFLVFTLCSVSLLRYFYGIFCLVFQGDWIWFRLILKHSTDPNSSWRWKLQVPSKCRNKIVLQQGLKSQKFHIIWTTSTVKTWKLYHLVPEHILLSLCIWLTQCSPTRVFQNIIRYSEFLE